ncbi:uncharacterized protein LOC135400036 isoform X1 [Ornithodoros turicata]|uniref:uncharacterized protein LOC135400036 isoform X1 n=1 Tax=Ornithodoros turicata TaxID=34597 RepID=UPI003139A0B0
MVSDKDLKKIAVVYSLVESLWCCYYIIFGYRTKFGNVREYMLYFDIYFGIECFLNSCSGVVLFSGMQKFRLPKEDLAENPPCYCITMYIEEPLLSLKLYIIWSVIAATICFTGSCALAYCQKYCPIPYNSMKDEAALKKSQHLHENSIFSSLVFYFIYAVFKALVLIVMWKFYYHHLRKVRNGQPLYTPYDHGHRGHQTQYSVEHQSLSKYLMPPARSPEAPATPNFHMSAANLTN